MYNAQANKLDKKKKTPSQSCLKAKPKTLEVKADMIS